MERRAASAIRAMELLTPDGSTVAGLLVVDQEDLEDFEKTALATAEKKRDAERRQAEESAELRQAFERDTRAILSRVCRIARRTSIALGVAEGYVQTIAEREAACGAGAGAEQLVDALIADRSRLLVRLGAIAGLSGMEEHLAIGIAKEALRECSRDGSNSNSSAAASTESGSPGPALAESR